MCKPPVICSYSTPFKAGVGRHFDPRSPRGERRAAPVIIPPTEEISIHAPREGSDRGWPRPGWSPAQNFYPRSPRGERQVGLSRAEVANIISIHAPREGSDVASHPPASWPPHFYPRSPRGERRPESYLQLLRVYFYPRSPRGERRCRRRVCHGDYGHFYPRSPRGERPGASSPNKRREMISIHAPREGSD